VSLPLALSLYRGFTRLAAPLFPILLNHRASKGKEDSSRRHERLGRPIEPRPEGDLVWLHGASIGESLVLATLVDELGGLRPDLSFIVTTGTTTSADLMAKRLPSNARHQYVPIDTPAAVKGFLDHWQPTLAVFAESELWANLILETSKRAIPMALVNARMNDKSLSNWRKKRPDTARFLFSCFDWIGTADLRTQDGLEEIMGEVVTFAGNLKLEARAVEADPHTLSQARVDISGRHVWLAASTHEGEEEIILKAHSLLLEKHPLALLVLAPRHPERAKSIAGLIKKKKFGYALRSANQLPHTDDQVWLADTLGEMPLWFSLAPAALIAGSLKKNIGGHNPIEANQAGAAVICGPHHASFQDLFDTYRTHKAALFVEDAQSLAQAVEDIWTGKGPKQDSARAAIAEASGGALQTTLSALISLLPGDEDDLEARQ